VLFLLNKMQPDTFDLIRLLGGDQEKEALLVEDAVFYASDHWLPKFHAAGVGTLYAAQDAVAERSLSLAAECQTVDYERIVDLLMEEHERVICL